MESLPDSINGATGSLAAQARAMTWGCYITSQAQYNTLTKILELCFNTTFYRYPLSWEESTLKAHSVVDAIFICTCEKKNLGKICWYLHIDFLPKNE